MKTTTYYNTTDLQDEQLNVLIESAKKQNVEVLDVAKTLKIFTASLIHKFMLPKNGKKPPLTSIRRALNTLEYKHCKVKKTGKTRLGIYGRQENIYTLVK